MVSNYRAAILIIGERAVGTITTTCRSTATWGGLSVGLLMFSAPSFAEEAADDKQAKGMAIIGQLLAGTEAGGIPLPESFTQYTVEHLFGDVW